MYVCDDGHQRGRRLINKNDRRIMLSIFHNHSSLLGYICEVDNIILNLGILSFYYVHLSFKMCFLKYFS